MGLRTLWLAPLLVACTRAPTPPAPPPDGPPAVPVDAGAHDLFRPPADLAPAPLFTESLVGTDVPAARVGMFYLAWHAPAATAQRTVASRGGTPLTIEDAIRGNGAPAYADVLVKWGLEGNAMSFYYQAHPQLGFYCLYRTRPGQPGLVPDCPDIQHTAATHAAQLLDAGIDFVVLDATNLSGMDAAGDLLQLRPIEVLFEEWARLRQGGARTPQIAVWHAVPTGSTQWRGYQALYQAAAYDGLVMRDRRSGKKVFFVVDPPDAGRAPDPGIVAQIEADGGRNDVLVQRMWTISRTDPGVDRWAFMSPCQSGGQATTSLVGAGPCGQPHTPKSTLGSAVAVSPSYQTSYASLPFAAAGKLGGLTYARQWATALALGTDYVFVSGWNEFIAQPQPNPFGADPFAYSMGLERDPDGAHLFVDTYGAGFGRDIEPTQEYGTFYYDLTRACVKRWRSGARSCEDAADPCCAAGSGEWVNVSVLANDGVHDTLLTTDALEKRVLLGSGWREVCARTGTPTSFCVRAMEPSAPAGPFIAYAQGAAGRQALHRCLSGARHFYTLDPGCEGATLESVLAWLAPAPGGDTPRRATRCYRLATGDHFVAVGAGCPADASDEGVLGYMH